MCALKFFLRNATDGVAVTWELPVVVVSTSFQVCFPASEIEFHPLHPDTGAPLHEVCVWFAVREEPNLHLKFLLRSVTVGMRSPGNFLFSSCQKSFQEMVKVTRKLDNTVHTASTTMRCA